MVHIWNGSGLNALGWSGLIDLFDTGDGENGVLCYNVCYATMCVFLLVKGKLHSKWGAMLQRVFYFYPKLVFPKDMIWNGLGIVFEELTVLGKSKIVLNYGIFVNP